MHGECGMNVLSSKAPSPLRLGGWQPSELNYIVVNCARHQREVLVPFSHSGPQDLVFSGLWSPRGIHMWTHMVPGVVRAHRINDIYQESQLAPASRP